MRKNHTYHFRWDPEAESDAIVVGGCVCVCATTPPRTTSMPFTRKTAPKRDATNPKTVVHKQTKKELRAELREMRMRHAELGRQILFGLDEIRVPLNEVHDMVGCNALNYAAVPGSGKRYVSTGPPPLMASDFLYGALTRIAAGARELRGKGTLEDPSAYYHGSPPRHDECLPYLPLMSLMGKMGHIDEETA